MPPEYVFTHGPLPRQRQYQFLHGKCCTMSSCRRIQHRVWLYNNYSMWEILWERKLMGVVKVLLGRGPFWHGIPIYAICEKVWISGCHWIVFPWERVSECHRAGHIAWSEAHHFVPREQHSKRRNSPRNGYIYSCVIGSIIVRDNVTIHLHWLPLLTVQWSLAPDDCSSDPANHTVIHSCSIELLTVVSSHFHSAWARITNSPAITISIPTTITEMWIWGPTECVVNQWRPLGVAILTHIEPVAVGPDNLVKESQDYADRDEDSPGNRHQGTCIHNRIFLHIQQKDSHICDFVERASSLCEKWEFVE